MVDEKQDNKGEQFALHVTPPDLKLFLLFLINNVNIDVGALITFVTFKLQQNRSTCADNKIAALK